MPSFEFTALKMLSDAETRLKAESVELWLAALTPQALQLNQRSPLGARLAQACERYQALVRVSEDMAASRAGSLEARAGSDDHGQEAS